MAATRRAAIVRDLRKERKEEKWASFFADDDDTQVEETWESSVEALLTHRKVSEESDD